MGLLTSSGSLSLLFPPSLPVIMFGVVSQTSINKLFTAGMVSGVLLIVLLSLYSVFTAWRSKAVRIRPSVKELIQAGNKAKWELFIPVLMGLGISGGFVTLGRHWVGRHWVALGRSKLNAR